MRTLKCVYQVLDLSKKTLTHLWGHTCQSWLLQLPASDAISASSFRCFNVVKEGSTFLSSLNMRRHHLTAFLPVWVFERVLSRVMYGIEKPYSSPTVHKTLLIE